MIVKVDFVPDSPRHGLLEIRSVVTVSNILSRRHKGVLEVLRHIFSDMHMPVYIEQKFHIVESQVDKVVVSIIANSINFGHRTGNVASSYTDIRNTIIDAVEQVKQALG